MSRYTYNEDYLCKIDRTLRRALSITHRLTAIRVDLRFPASDVPHREDSAAITRFSVHSKPKFRRI